MLFETCACVHCAAAFVLAFVAAKLSRIGKYPHHPATLMLNYVLQIV